MLEEQNGHAADAHDTSIDGQKSPYDHEMSSHDHNNHDASSRLTPLKFFAILALAANYVGSNINSYFIGLVLLFMKADLKLNSTESSWIPVASSLTFACTAPCVGYLQDIFGRRNTLILGGLAGILGNGLMAGAHSFVTALIGSTFTGLANSLGELTAIAAVSELVPVSKRGLFLAINTVLVLPLTPSVLYTELISRHSTWRWCFGLCAMWNGMALLALLPTYCRLDIVRPSQEKRVTAIKSIDYIGMSLLIIGCALFLVALQAGGQLHPWNSPYVLVQFFVGLALLLVLVLWEWKGAANPVIPFRLFTGQRVVGVTYIIAFLVGINYFAILTIGPQVLVSVFYPGEITTGLWSLGPSLSLMTGATLVNVLLTALGGRARELTFIFAVIMTAFTGAQAVIDPKSPAKTVVFTSLAALGVGGLLVPTSTIVTFACPQDLIGTAVALVAAVRTIGGSIGYAVLNNILVSKQKKLIPAMISEYAVKAGLPPSKAGEFAKTFIEIVQADPSKATQIPVDHHILEAAAAGFKQGNAGSAKYVFYGNLAFGVVAILMCLLLPNISKFMTSNVVAKTGR